MRIAAIDMGTNTFNLLVVEYLEDGSFTILHQETRGVMLGKEGLDNGMISPRAMTRGIDAIGHFIGTIGAFGVSRIKAYATSAIRGARNGSDFARHIADTFSIEVEIISGNREAELIYKGVNASFDLGNAPMLIMDIGGGSNEFIVCSASEIYWKQSFPLGMSRLMERFSPSDPITTTEIAAIESYLTDGLALLWSAAARYSPTVLIGSSGAFDTFRDTIFYGNDTVSPARELPIEALQQLHETLLASTLNQRRAMKGMNEVRVEMIVLASILTKVVRQKTGVNRVMHTSYSLKEGAIVEMIGR